MALQWAMGERVFVRIANVLQPCTIRGGREYEVRNERGFPLWVVEVYLVVPDETGKYEEIDGKDIVGEVPE